MLARTAENLYWMARYLERAENTARLIDSVTDILLDLPSEAFGWTSLVEIAGLDERFHACCPQADETAIMGFLIEDARNPSSILSCVHQARENARTLREMLPSKMWEAMNGLQACLRAQAADAVRSRRERYTLLNRIMEQCHAMVGLMGGAMPRDLPYQFIKLGRNMERVWMSTLGALSGYHTYRRLVSMEVTGPAVTHFLLGDARFPRSVAYCLSEVSGCLGVMPRSAPLRQPLVRMHQHLAGVDTASAATLHDDLDALQEFLAEYHNLLARHYFHPDPQAPTVAEAG